MSFLDTMKSVMNQGASTSSVGAAGNSSAAAGTVGNVNAADQSSVWSWDNLFTDKTTGERLKEVDINDAIEAFNKFVGEEQDGYQDFLMQIANLHDDDGDGAPDVTRNETTGELEGNISAADLASFDIAREIFGDISFAEISEKLEQAGGFNNAVSSYVQGLENETEFTTFVDQYLTTNGIDISDFTYELITDPNSDKVNGIIDGILKEYGAQLLESYVAPTENEYEHETARGLDEPREGVTGAQVTPEQLSDMAAGFGIDIPEDTEDVNAYLQENYPNLYDADGELRVGYNEESGDYYVISDYFEPQDQFQWDDENQTTGTFVADDGTEYDIIGEAASEGDTATGSYTLKDESGSEYTLTMENGKYVIYDADAQMVSENKDHGDKPFVPKDQLSVPGNILDAAYGHSDTYDIPGVEGEVTREEIYDAMLAYNKDILNGNKNGGSFQHGEAFVIPTTEQIAEFVNAARDYKNGVEGAQEPTAQSINNADGTVQNAVLDKYVTDTVDTAQGGEGAGTAADVDTGEGAGTAGGAGTADGTGEAGGADSAGAAGGTTEAGGAEGDTAVGDGEDPDAVTGADADVDPDATFVLADHITEGRLDEVAIQTIGQEIAEGDFTHLSDVLSGDVWAQDLVKIADECNKTGDFIGSLTDAYEGNNITYDTYKDTIANIFTIAGSQPNSLSNADTVKAAQNVLEQGLEKALETGNALFISNITTNAQDTRYSGYVNELLGVKDDGTLEAKFDGKNIFEAIDSSDNLKDTQKAALKRQVESATGINEDTIKMFNDYNFTIDANGLHGRFEDVVRALEDNRIDWADVPFEKLSSDDLANIIKGYDNDRGAGSFMNNITTNLVNQPNNAGYQNALQTLYTQSEGDGESNVAIRTALTKELQNVLGATYGSTADYTAAVQLLKYAPASFLGFDSDTGLLDKSLTSGTSYYQNNIFGLIDAKFDGGQASTLKAMVEKTIGMDEQVYSAYDPYMRDVLNGKTPKLDTSNLNGQQLSQLFTKIYDVETAAGKNPNLDVVGNDKNVITECLQTMAKSVKDGSISYADYLAAVNALDNIDNESWIDTGFKTLYETKQQGIDKSDYAAARGARLRNGEQNIIDSVLPNAIKGNEAYVIQQLLANPTGTIEVFGVETNAEELRLVLLHSNAYSADTILEYAKQIDGYSTNPQLQAQVWQMIANIS